MTYSRVKRRLEQYRVYNFVRDAKHSVESLFLHYYGGSRIVTIQPEGPIQGKVLISYMTEAFQPKPTENWHVRSWESREMAKTFVDLGYSADVCDYRDRGFVPRKDYAVVVDVEDNLERFTPLLDKACLKIFHITTAHPLFNNAAEAARLLALKERRGVVVPAVRQFLRPHHGIEFAHCATVEGNQFVQNTYRYANKPIHRVPAPSALIRPWPGHKNFDACRRRFMWFGSHGVVHKGLDLVLEAFSGMPELELFVCGPVKKEPAFVRAYEKELYHTRNIQTVDWVDLASESFCNLMNSCIGHVFPSSSEGAGICVIDTMHAGLIPIVSYESAVDVHDFGLLLKTSTIDDIQDAVKTIADLPASELERRARKAWEHARANHTRERFAEEYRSTIKTILNTYRR